MTDELIQVHRGCTDCHDAYPIHFDPQDNSFHLDSCDSHGGCVAAEGIIFCPYCGERLEHPVRVESRHRAENIQW